MGVFRDIITGSMPPAKTFTAPAVTDWKNPKAGLGQDVIDYLKKNQVPDVAPEGQKYAGMTQIGINGAGMYVLPGGDASFGTPGYGVVSGGQGGEYWYKPLTGNETNAANYVYNADGSYNRTEYNSHIMSPAAGVASVFGAALGFGAIGAAAAGGAAAGAGAAGAGAGVAGVAAEAAPATFGVLDAGAAQLSAAGGFTSAAPFTSFGALDQAAGYQSLAGPMGVTYGAAGVPTQFGVINQAAGQMSLEKAAVAAGAGAGGGGGGGAGTGTGTGTGTATGAGSGIASKLGLPAALDKLGGQVLASGVSSIVGSMLSPKPDMSAPTVRDPALTPSTETKTKAVSEMPDPLAMQRSRKRSIIEQLGRRGRASTVLTSGGGRLGG